MNEAKIDFHSLIVENLLSNRGFAQKMFSPLALIGADIIVTKKVWQWARLVRVKQSSGGVILIKGTVVCNIDKKRVLFYCLKRKVYPPLLIFPILKQSNMHIIVVVFYWYIFLSRIISV